LVTDSVNAELDQYVAGLPDTSDYDHPSSFDEGFFGLGNGYGYDMQDSLDIAFARENEIFDEYSQKRLDDLLNNFIKEKGRRCPNDQELAAWLDVSCVRFPDASCKIFDLRGMNYVLSDFIRRFVVIVHLDVDKWARFSVPAEYQ